MNTLKRSLFVALAYLVATVIDPGTTKAQAWQPGDSLDVHHYDIHLRLVHLSQQKISGYAELTLSPKVDGLNLATLHLLKMNIDSIVFKNTTLATFSYNDTVLAIQLPLTQNTSDTFSLRIYYNGTPQKDPSGWGGFYFTSDSSYAYNLGVGFDSDPHNFGRVWFPCADNFTDRALYDYHITVKDIHTAVCGGSLQGITNHGDGSCTYHWKMHNSIPTYLASIAVGRYALVADTFAGMNGAIPITLYVRPADTNKAKASFINLKTILGIFESRFGPYRFERIGYVGVPFNSGAMEHATNIAYPNSCIDGTLSWQDLYAHELAHMWFGDATTCSSALDMWINEGWASYCEAIYKEGLSGRQAYKNHIRNNHKEVLQYAHIKDGSYMAVYGIPHTYTYGTTVYDKGADMTHTLRGYLGDSLFFGTVQQMLSSYAFDHISTAGMRDYITAVTGIDMTSFFDAWIFSPGFPHFSVDSFRVSPGPVPEATVEVFFRQKLNHAPGYANDNILEVSFINSNWQFFTDTVHFSGVSGVKTFTVPFVPDVVAMDIEEKISDATTDLYMTVKSAGVYDFATTFFQADVASVTDSAWLRVEHNWVAPDPVKTASPDIKRLSDYRYWKIDGILPASFSSGGKFRYNRTSWYLDNTLLPYSSSVDSILLLYRANTSDDWTIEPFIKSGTNTTGWLITDTLKRGEYTLAVGTPYTSGTGENIPVPINKMKVFPNPSAGSFQLELHTDAGGKLSIYDLAGKRVFRENAKPGAVSLNWAPRNKENAVFLVQLTDHSGRLIEEEKIVYVR